jgi:hypothetical protein
MLIPSLLFIVMLILKLSKLLLYYKLYILYLINIKTVVSSIKYFL